MALYAVNEDDLIHASDAEPRKIYWCMDCFGPVKRRRGRLRFPHFYHVSPAKQCRLYSKTQDHLLVQIQIQKSFPSGIIQIERPFSKINRVADLCWENEKIVFEIQCSLMSPKEAEMRIHDYRSIGYEVVWLLDDKKYNKRIIRPVEKYLREKSAYYMTIKQGLTSNFYDQFEIFAEGKRVKKGKKLQIDLKCIRNRPNIFFSEKHFPKQIVNLQCKKYFYKDRTHKALLNNTLAMQNWRALEIHFVKKHKKPNLIRKFFTNYVSSPYLRLLETLINKSYRF